MFQEIRHRKGSGMEKAALQVGENSPAFLLRANTGKMVDSKVLLPKGRLVVTFSHGSWSSMCIIALKALQALHQTLEAEGVTLVVISPELLDVSPVV
jgi:peroxiredoxin